MSLGRSLKDILDVGGDDPTLDAAAVTCEPTSTDGRRASGRTAARRRGPARPSPDELDAARTGGAPTWLDDVFHTVGRQLRATPATAGGASTGPREPSADAPEQDHRGRTRGPSQDKQRGHASSAREAEAQLELLPRDGRRGRPVRLLQLPLLRQRGLPARLQLPAPAALGLHPRPARRRRATTSSSRARASSRSPSSARGPSSTTRARAT